MTTVNQNMCLTACSWGGGVHLFSQASAADDWISVKHGLFLPTYSQPFALFLLHHSKLTVSAVFVWMDGGLCKVLSVACSALNIVVFPRLYKLG